MLRSSRHHTALYLWKGALRAALLLGFLLLNVFFAAAGEPLFCFVALGDQGCACKAQHKVAKAMIDWHEEHPYDLVLMLGDNMYETHWFLFFPRKRKCTEQLLRDVFDRPYGELLEKGVDFRAVIGNHDSFCEGSMEAVMKERFRILGRHGYYTFTPAVEVEGGPLITFLALNSTTMENRQEDPEQMEWLDEEASNSRAVWKVALTHHPIRTPSGKHQPKEPYRSTLENALVSNGIRLLLSGHNHYYARMKPHRGFVQFISGGGGRWLHTPRMAPWTARAVRAHHFLYFEVYPRRVDFKSVGASGEVIDEGSIPLEDG